MRSYKGSLPCWVAFALLTIMFCEMLFHLSSFPGLHGDEAWFGLRAMDIRLNGLKTISGMTSYSGALFPAIVATSFSLFGSDVFSLRLPGAILNIMAVGLLVVAFRKDGYAGPYIAILLASSLLFLFYSRVAWEVCALQNVLLALIIYAINQVATSRKLQIRSTLLIMIAFSLGTLNHLIFLTASLAFVLAASLLVLSTPSTESARLFLVGIFNLSVQGAILFGKHHVSNGAFTTHALPAALVCLILIVSASILCIKTELHSLPRLVDLLVKHRSRCKVFFRVIVVAVGLVFLFTLPGSGLVFFGAIAGVIMLGRVSSYVPSSLEILGMTAWMSVMTAVFAASLLRQVSSPKAVEGKPFRGLIVLWAAAYFPCLLIATSGISERYYIIPQLIFFSALALEFNELSFRWRHALHVVLVLGFAQAQHFLLRETLRPGNLQPIIIQYGPYADTSRHFLKLQALETYLHDRNICHIRSSSLFLANSVQFLLQEHDACGNNDSVDLEYCDTCREPIEWFSSSPVTTHIPRGQRNSKQF